MQKIQKFHFGRLYVAPKSAKTYELITRDGHRLVFRVRNPKTRDSWKQLATSTYQADETGAFEVVLFQDGTRLRADAWCSDPQKVRRMAPRTQQEIIKLMAEHGEYDGLIIFTDGYAPKPNVPARLKGRLLWILRSEKEYNEHRKWMIESGRTCFIENPNKQ